MVINMDLYEKYKDDLDAQNFIWFCQQDTPSTDEEIDKVIVEIRKVFNLQDALHVLRGFKYCKLEKVN